MSIQFHRASFSNGNAQIAAFTGDGLYCSVAPIDRVLLYRIDNPGTSELLLPNNYGLALQPVSVFFQYTTGSPSITFNIKRTTPSTATIMSFTVGQSGFAFPVCAIPQDYIVTMTCSGTITYVSLFCKPIDVIDVIPIVG